MIRLRLERRLPPLWLRPLVPFLSVLGTFLIVSILLLLRGVNPFEAFYYFLAAPLVRWGSAVEVLVKATPLILTGAAAMFAFSAGYWNIGGEGQFLAGAVAGAGIGMIVGNLPPAIAIPLMALGGFAAGMLWALIPALLKTRLDVDEVVTTLLMNTVILFLISWLLNGPWRSPVSGWPQSPEIAAAAEYPRLIPRTRLHMGFAAAVVVMLALYFLMLRTPLGLRMRAAGLGREAARFAGISIQRTMFAAALISGGIAGLAGLGEVAGIHYHLIDAIASGVGYNGIIVAMLGSLHPIGVTIAALFLGLIETGAQNVSQALGMPIYLGNVVEAVLLLVTLAMLVLQNYRVRRV